MGRRKAYEREGVLTLALNAFWAEGYHSTSARALADSTGVNVSTLYSEFGSKEGLYSAALEMYERDVVTAFFGPLEAPDATIATVRATLRQFPAMAKQVSKAPGCLVTNAAVEQAPTPLASHDAMGRYIDRVSAGIQHAISNTRDARPLDPAAAERFAHQLVAVFIGLFVMTRAQVDPAILDDVVESAVVQLDAFVDGRAS